jgi:hypothetical protein
MAPHDSPTQLELSRVDVGVRQLEAAASLHFRMENETATRTLAAASAWLFQGLADTRHRGMRLSNLAQSLAISEGAYIDALQSALWLLQYSHNSPLRLSWQVAETELLIVAAILNAEELCIPLGPGPRIFKLWYFARHPGALERQTPETKNSVAEAFSALTHLPEREQRMAGGKLLEKRRQESA